MNATLNNRSIDCLELGARARNAEPFAAGAIVRLKSAKHSSSPWMTVREIDASRSVVCAWFNGNWDICIERFKAEMLQHENEVSNDNPR